MEQGPNWVQEVLQPACFSHRDVPGMGIWSSHSCSRLLCAIYSSGKNNIVHGLCPNVHTDFIRFYKQHCGVNSFI